MIVLKSNLSPYQSNLSRIDWQFGAVTNSVLQKAPNCVFQGLQGLRLAAELWQNFDSTVLNLSKQYLAKICLPFSYIQDPGFKN